MIDLEEHPELSFIIINNLDGEKLAKQYLVSLQEDESNE